MSKLRSKPFGGSFLKDAILAPKECNLSESEFAELQTTQEIEERISKSFLALDAFTSELASGSGSGGGGSSGGTGTGTGSGGCYPVYGSGGSGSGSGGGGNSGTGTGSGGCYPVYGSGGSGSGSGCGFR